MPMARRRQFDDGFPTWPANGAGMSIPALIPRLILSAACLILLAASISGGDVVVVKTGTASQRASVEWAIGRFSDAGMVLPRIIVEFPGRDLSGCDGAPGRSYLDQSPIVIKMCWNDRFILLHEFAHVWEANNVFASKHRPFMAIRLNVESWASRDVEWELRGREHAANVIAWGLLVDPISVSDTYPNDPASMTAAFKILTDRVPLHDGGSGVQIPDKSLFQGRSNPRLELGR